MKYTPGGESQDIEDRRDEGGGGGGYEQGGLGGGMGGIGLGGRHIGIGGLLVLGLLSLVFKRDLLSPFIGGGGGDSAYDNPVAASAPNPARTQAEQPTVQFVSFVIDDVQKYWEQTMPTLGKQYRHAKLVLFRDQTNSGCGAAQEASGPFYCPEDEKVYIDLGFYDELKQRFGAPGQFAQAYVLAHEVGHHIQKILGIEAQVRQLQQRNPANENPLSVRLELQADCFAGMWGHSASQRGLLETGDVESGLGAAAAVGDDRIARMSGVRANPEKFTHGSAAQRTTWFKRGLDTGQLQNCDTFGGQ